MNNVPTVYVPDSSKLDDNIIRSIRNMPMFGVSEEYLIWNDKMIDNYPGIGRVECNDTTVAALGENMLIMLTGGPRYRLTDIVTTLALNLRDPTGEPVFSVFTAPPPAAGSQISDIASTTALELIDKHTKRRTPEFDMQETQGLQQQPRDLKQVERFLIGADFDENDDSLKALTRVFAVTRTWTMILQSQFYSFLAAVLCRASVKEEDALKRHMTSLVEKFVGFYGLSNVPFKLPDPDINALKSLKVGLIPGGDHFVCVLRAFLIRRYPIQEPIPEIRGILDYTLLLHCSYNGMQLISLIIAAAGTIGDDNLTSTLYQFKCDKTKGGIINITHYFETYAPESPHYPGKFAPWSRLFDSRFWSRLSVRHHPVLGSLLMAFLMPDNPDIFKMMACKASSSIKEQAIQIMNEYHKYASTKPLTAGASPIPSWDNFHIKQASRPRSQRRPEDPYSALKPETREVLRK